MQEKNLNVRNPIEAGIYVAILAILIYLSTFVPLNLIISFALPLPAAYIYVKYGFRYFLASLLAALITSIVIMNIANAISFFIMLAVISTTLGYCMKNNIKTAITFAIISGFYILFAIFYFTVLIKIFIGMDYGTLVGSISKMFQGTINDAKTIYINNGMSKSQINSLVDPLSEAVSKKSLENLIPSLVIIVSVVYSFIECAITTYFLKTKKLKVPSMIQFTKIHMPNLGIAFGIIGACIGILMDTYNIGPGEVIYTTVMIIGESALLVCGISLVVNILKSRSHISNALIVLIIILTVIFPVTAYGYQFLGLIDAFADFRKVALNSANKK